MLGCAVMFKLVYCITRRPGMSLEEFSRYWREVHGPIGRRIPGLRRLVQSHPLPRPADIVLPAFDGMAELWFDDVAALEAARRSAEWRGARREEESCIDAERDGPLFTWVDKAYSQRMT